MQECSKLEIMPVIKRSIQVSYELRVHFTENAFEPSNVVLRNVLSSEGAGAIHQALVVLDESLAQAQPGLEQRIVNYFAAHGDRLNLVCPPIVIEGGERTKNSYFHVSEIHSQI